MSYSSITKPEDHFNTITWSGDSSSPESLTVGFQPDWIWGKLRNTAYNHQLYDSVRGFGNDKDLQCSQTAAEGGGTADQYGYISGTISTGFTATKGSDGGADGYGYWNESGRTYVAWNWLAGGTAPAITYSVKVVSDSGNKYRFDDYGTSAVTLDLQEGGTYTFDQSDSSNSGHPLRFSTTSDGSHGGGSEYTTGVTTTGTPGSAGAKTVITVAASAPTLYYYCTQHSGMGGQANTNSTHGSSNFSGSIQSTVSTNTTAGFSVVTYTGTGSAATIGHGLGTIPKWYFVKRRDAGSSNWHVYHSGNAATQDIRFNLAEAAFTTDIWNDTAPTSTLFNVKTSVDVNASSGTYIGYCFNDVKGYSKFGTYSGNGNANGASVHTGFKPAFVIIKNKNGTDNWNIYDDKRLGFNTNYSFVFANGSNAENTTTSTANLDILSNGFKVRASTGHLNTSGNTYLFMAFAKNPFVANDSGTAVPVTAR